MRTRTEGTGSLYRLSVIATLIFVNVAVAYSPLSPVHTSNMSKQHVERCFDMSNVAVRHVAVFGNMSNDFFILLTCRNKLNMFNFFRHVECRLLQVACCFDMLPVAVRHVASTCCWCGRGFTRNMDGVFLHFYMV